MKFLGSAIAAAFLGSVAHAAGTLTAAVTLTATALIVPGTATPDPSTVPGYMQNAVDYYIAPTTPSCAVVCVAEPVPYIAQFWPFPWAGWGGLTGAKFDVSVASGLNQLNSDLVGTNNPSADNPVVVFGYSQGATVSTREKSILTRLSPADQANINYVLIGNPNRPNGGLFERLAMFGTVPILDATFGLPTPTDTAMGTVDIAFQYDGVVDFPRYPINLLADLNAVAGFWYTHGGYLGSQPNGLTPTELAAAIADPANQQRIAGSDTTYIMIPTPNLPLLEPLREFAAFTGTQALVKPIIDLIQPALRVLIETGYDRSLPYSTPAPFQLIPRVNPITVAGDLVAAIGQGIHDAVRDINPPSAQQRSVKTVAAKTPTKATGKPPHRKAA